jgi:3-phenylpropionate/trans-cinnamate dioxygenase ferredoxin reductase subunit
MRRIVVVGASLAGVHAAVALRREGFDGELVVADAQGHTPYDRPPLSKELLTGRFTPADIALRPANDLDVTWQLGSAARSLQLAADGGGVVTVGDDELAFDGLVIACGAAARHLPGTDGVPGVQVLRTLDDATALAAAVDGGLTSLVVVGAGFIGLEVAASCRSRGVDVTVVEPLPQPLGRVVGEDVGAAIAAVHRHHGVDVRCGVSVASVADAGPSGVAVTLDDGSVIEAGRVVVGIGVQPATGWLEGSGLTLDDGVVCDETLLAAASVVAAGDIARWPSRRYGTMLRVEHWDHAVASGEAAGRRLLAGDTPEVFDPVPWFWSDQYDTKIQLVGRPGPDAQVVSGGFDEDRFAVVYGNDGVVTGVLGVNRPRHVAMMRAAVADAMAFDDAVDKAAAL